MDFNEERTERRHGKICRGEICGGEKGERYIDDARYPRIIIVMPSIINGRRYAACLHADGRVLAFIAVICEAP